MILAAWGAEGRCRRVSPTPSVVAREPHTTRVLPGPAATGFHRVSWPSPQADEEVVIVLDGARNIAAIEETVRLVKGDY